ncbi:hypothetical protein ANN_02303 [Periplaneta americana]|uniref:dCMP deaminase n=1 Tax=Periplaneta americana TaxID=6978 RepID=A0ABQ8TYD6_PERAM|nr:hypothetical protein ANN_02303 [Periplaneta americana]
MEEQLSQMKLGQSSEALSAKEKSSDINNKRNGYLSWTDYFMATAFLAAKRSKDPCSQVGACIVNEDKKIVGVGYNGMPIGCSDDVFPWGKRTDNLLDTKYLYVCHAEVNAILNKNSADVKNCTMYVALFPCNECAKIIIQSGIKEVVYMSDKYASKVQTIAAKRMFDSAGIKYCQLVRKLPTPDVKSQGNRLYYEFSDSVDEKDV